MDGDHPTWLGWVPATALGLLAAHASGIAPVGIAGVLGLAGTAGFAAERAAAGDHRTRQVLREAAVAAAVAMVVGTLAAALQVRVQGGGGTASLLRGSYSWLWAGFADVHAAAWGAPGASPGALAPTLGAAAVSATLRPAALWFVARRLLRPAWLPVRALPAGLALCALAALLALPGAGAARVLSAPELTTAAALLGVLAARTPQLLERAPRWAIALPFGAHPLATMASALLWLPVLQRASDGAPDALTFVVLVAGMAVLGVLTGVAAAMVQRRVPFETFALWAPPLVVLTLLVLWQATAAFTWSDPYYT